MQAELRRELHGAGLRVTTGRLALLEVLHSLPHSDAETLFQTLRETLPGTSIQSVHNVLGDLTEAGIIRRIEPAGSPARYERRIGDTREKRFLLQHDLRVACESAAVLVRLPVAFVEGCA